MQRLQRDKSRVKMETRCRLFLRRIIRKNRHNIRHTSDRYSQWLNVGMGLVITLASCWLCVSIRMVLRSYMLYPTFFGTSEEEQICCLKYLMSGRDIYGSITAEFIPIIYLPGYFITIGLWSSLLGLSIVSIRLFHITVIIGILCVIWLLVRKVGGGKLQSLLGCVIWIGLLQFFQGVPLKVGPDTLMSLFVLVGVICLASGDSWRWLIFSALSFTAAALTKQNMLPLVCLPAFVGLVCCRSVRKMLVALIPVMGGGILALAANAEFGGRMFEWGFASLAGHP